jgi:hypothetical protein
MSNNLTELEKKVIDAIAEAPGFETDFHGEVPALLKKQLENIGYSFRYTSYCTVISWYPGGFCRTGRSVKEEV